MLRDPNEHGDDIYGVLAEADQVHDAAIDSDLADALRLSVPRAWPRMPSPDVPPEIPRRFRTPFPRELNEDLDGNSVLPEDAPLEPGPWNRWGVSRETWESVQQNRYPSGPPWGVSSGFRPQPRKVRAIDRLMLRGAWVLEVALEALLDHVARAKNKLEYRVGGIRPEDMMNLSDYMEPPSLHEELGVHVSDGDDFSHASLRRLGVWGPTERWDGEAGIFRKFW